MINENKKSNVCTNPILKGLSRVMKREGFKRKSSNWYYNTKETILVVNIQSDYSWRYINFGVWIKKLADQEYIDSFKEYNTTVDQEHPKHYQCHIYFRPVHFPESIKPIAREVFNLKSEAVTNEEREMYIIEWLNKYEMPLLKQCVVIEKIVEFIYTNKFKSAFISIEVKKLIIPLLLRDLQSLTIKKRYQGHG